MKNYRVSKAGQLERWGALRIIRNTREPSTSHDAFLQIFDAFFNGLQKTIGFKNVGNATEIWTRVIVRGNEAALKKEFDYCEQKGIRFLVIVLPEKDTSIYKQIKILGDVDYGIQTVCVVADNRKFNRDFRFNDQYYANVALKINLKLEGTNHTLQNHTTLYEKTMVIGIDVTHPSPGPTQRTAPSVAAMVASVDQEVLSCHFHSLPGSKTILIFECDKLAQWLVDLRINTARKEMVDLLGPMLTSRLELWKSKHDGYLPDNLLIYRDGVSESQYETVLDEEMKQMRNTCDVMYQGRVPPRITLIVVGKRHHTRFFKRKGHDWDNPVFGT